MGHGASPLLRVDVGVPICRPTPRRSPSTATRGKRAPSRTTVILLGPQRPDTTMPQHAAAFTAARRFESATADNPGNRRVDDAVRDRWLAKVVHFIREQLSGDAPCQPRAIPPWYDRRPQARSAFEAYVKQYASCTLMIEAHLARSSAEVSTHRDTVRVPIACVVGSSGSGKTTQLELLCEDFGQNNNMQGMNPAEQSIAVYFTLSAFDIIHQPIDQDDTTSDRLTRRILHGLVSHRSDLREIVDGLKRIEVELCAEHDVPTFRSWMFDAIPQIIRGVHGAVDSAPILIAADELRVWATGMGTPEVGNPSPMAVLMLQTLAVISQAAAMRRARARVAASLEPPESSRAPPGPVYIAASAFAAFDPALGLTQDCCRQVFYMPLPPLNPSMYDNALFAAAANEHIYFVLRATLFSQCDNARLLAGTAVNATQNAESITTATEFREQVLDRRQAAIKIASDRVSAVLSLADRRRLLTTLFQRTKYDTESTAFPDRMQPALRCSAVGVATILRDATTDSVFMPPMAIEEMLCKSRALQPDESDLLRGLCSRMLELPEPPSNTCGNGNAGKLSAQIITRAFALRVNTLMSASIDMLSTEMSLYEFLKGALPPDDAASFFTTTTVHGWSLPLKEAPNFVFPRAAFACQDPKARRSFERSMQMKFSQPLRFDPGTSADGRLWSNCEFQHEPPDSTPFYTVFAHDNNVLLDGCILLNVTFRGDPTPRNVLLGFQMKKKEHVSADRQIHDHPSLVTTHHDNVARICATCWRNRRMANWLISKERAFERERGASAVLE